MLMHWIPCPGQGDRLGRPLPAISCFANIYHNYSCRLQASCTPRLPLHSSLLTNLPVHTSAGQGYGQVSSAAFASPNRRPLVQTHSSRSAGLEASSSSTVQSGPLLPRNGSSPNGGDPMGSGDDDFAVNFGEAVETLREDLPCLFVRDPRFHIFREDLTFRTPSMRYSRGIWSYRVLHRAARYLGNLLYADMQLSITRMWQPAGSTKQLRVRWCVSGRPRFSPYADTEPQSTEVISTYAFDSHGKIYEHQVDQVIPPESMLVRLFEWLVGRLQPGLVPQPQLPLPGLRDSMRNLVDWVQ